MSTTLFTSIFIAALVLSVMVRLWLAARQTRHVLAHRSTVPARFAERVALVAHQKAADYTIAKTSLGVLEMMAGMVLLIALTLMGGLQALHTLLRELLGNVLPGLWVQVALVMVVVFLSSLIDLPFSLYRQFKLEARFGFNTMTLRLFFADMAKGTVIGLVLGVPLLAAVLALMAAAGPLWWLYAWGVWVSFNLVVLVLYPTVIAPLFNKFEPLTDDSLRERIDALLARCGFTAKGVFVMDGSKRSAHGNAYFTGFGAAKRIVFFDTLLARLTPTEIEAVLAHELGHFKKRHIFKRIAWSFALSLAGLALLGWLAQQTWFYTGLGVEPLLDGANGATALILFMFVLPLFTFPLAPLSSRASRKHEYEADAFAAQQANPGDLVQALVKLYQDNAATLTPDPIHSVFYDSHPPASLRISRLDAASASHSAARPAAQ
jgi:STE24 endopeptidase